MHRHGQKFQDEETIQSTLQKQSYNLHGGPKTSSIVRLDSGMILYLKQINRSVSRYPPPTLILLTTYHYAAIPRYLTLLCLVPRESFVKQSIVEYNMEVFQKSLEGISGDGIHGV